MKISLLLQELEELAERLGWEIRYEKGDFQSDSCQKDNQHLIIIQKGAPESERATHLARILGQEDLNGVFLLPRVRDFLDSHRSGGG
jgi:hypothetical protein